MYLLEQGMMSASGTGDYYEVHTFDDKEEAIKHFDEIKHDIKGWYLKPHGYLSTMLTDTASDTVVMLNDYRWWE